MTLQLQIKEPLTWETSQGQRLEIALQEDLFPAVSDLDIPTTTEDKSMGGTMSDFVNLATTYLPKNSRWLALAYVDSANQIRVQLACDSVQGAEELQKKYRNGPK